VFAAWADRNSLEFDATQEGFTKTHRLKAFEGQKICFFGFPAEEHQHMVDVLLENGGVCAELDDPECSHVVSLPFLLLNAKMQAFFLGSLEFVVCMLDIIYAVLSAFLPS